MQWREGGEEDRSFYYFSAWFRLLVICQKMHGKWLHERDSNRDRDGEREREEERVRGGCDSRRLSAWVSLWVLVRFLALLVACSLAYPNLTSPDSAWPRAKIYFTRLKQKIARNKAWKSLPQHAHRTWHQARKGGSKEWGGEKEQKEKEEEEMGCHQRQKSELELESFKRVLQLGGLVALATSASTSRSRSGSGKRAWRERRGRDVGTWHGA